MKLRYFFIALVVLLVVYWPIAYLLWVIFCLYIVIKSLLLIARWVKAHW